MRTTTRINEFNKSICSNPHKLNGLSFSLLVSWICCHLKGQLSYCRRVQNPFSKKKITIRIDILYFAKFIPHIQADNTGCVIDITGLCSCVHEPQATDFASGQLASLLFSYKPCCYAPRISWLGTFSSS